MVGEADPGSPFFPAEVVLPFFLVCSMPVTVLSRRERAAAFGAFVAGNFYLSLSLDFITFVAVLRGEHAGKGRSEGRSKPLFSYPFTYLPPDPFGLSGVSPTKGKR